MAIFPANATLLFQQPASAPRINAKGSPELAVTELIVTVYLKKGSQLQSRALNPDADLFQIPVVGRAVEPRTIPNGIKPGSTAEALLWRVDSAFRLPEGIASNAELEALVAAHEDRILQRGVFSLKADIGSAFGVQAILGDRIEGWLTTEVQWAEIQ